MKQTLISLNNEVAIITEKLDKNKLSPTWVTKKDFDICICNLKGESVNMYEAPNDIWLIACFILGSEKDEGVG